MCPARRSVLVVTFSQSNAQCESHRSCGHKTCSCELPCRLGYVRISKARAVHFARVLQDQLLHLEERLPVGVGVGKHARLLPRARAHRWQACEWL